jgi:hypothetical protein
MRLAGSASGLLACEKIVMGILEKSSLFTTFLPLFFRRISPSTSFYRAAMNGGEFISSPPRFRIQVALHEHPRVGFLTVVLDSGLRRNDGGFSVPGNSPSSRMVAFPGPSSKPRRPGESRDPGRAGFSSNAGESAPHGHPRVGFLTVVLDSGLRRNDGGFSRTRQFPVVPAKAGTQAARQILGERGSGLAGLENPRGGCSRRSSGFRLAPE